MKKTSQVTQEFAEDLWKIKDVLSGDKNLEDIEDWEELWIYLEGIRRIKFWKHQIARDPMGWYIKSYLLGPEGWELKRIGDYKKSLDEILIIDKYCIYECIY